MNKTLRPLARTLLALSLALGFIWLSLFVFFRRPTLGQLPILDLQRASPAALSRDVEALATGIPWRDSDHPENLDIAAAYIEEQLRAVGAPFVEQVYQAGGATYRNVVASFGPSEGALTVVGAHYDSFGLFGENPGADDNASGTAGLLELARLLSQHSPKTPVELVFYTNEEPPYFASDSMGSAVHAASLKQQSRSVKGMICLEMIGYFTERQPWPNILYRSLFPRQGDFIALIGRSQDSWLIHHLERAFRSSSPVPALGLTAPSWLPGVDASDHRNYWQGGYSAALVTDTAFVRNPNYHTPGDTAATLDYVSMAGVVQGVFRAILEMP